jgi:hypothetical protein
MSANSPVNLQNFLHCETHLEWERKERKHFNSNYIVDLENAVSKCNQYTREIPERS